MSTPQRQRILFALLMSLLMSALMTGWVTWLNLGPQPGFLAHWRAAFIAAWPAAFLIVVACGPTVQRASQALVARLSPQG